MSISEETMKGQDCFSHYSFLVFSILVLNTNNQRNFQHFLCVIKSLDAVLQNIFFFLILSASFSIQITQHCHTGAPQHHHQVEFRGAEGMSLGLPTISLNLSLS